MSERGFIVVAVFVGAVVVGATLAGIAPARASITSDDFVAILGPSADYLAASSDLALSAGGRAIRAAAQADASEGRALAADLAAWRTARAEAEAAAARAPTLDHLGPAANAIAVPLEAIARTASSPGYFFTRLPSQTRLDDASRADLARLSALAGAPFDDLYVATDLAALRRVEHACKDFVLNGDDETLRALAVHALPRLQRRIAMLARR